MFYNISRTLEVMPYISWSVLFIVWLFIEIKCYKEQLSDEPQAEPGRENFILPPGDGYEYYVSSNCIVYILRKARNRFRVYVVQGEMPGVKIKKDQYGMYFNARCQDTGSAERIVDKAFGM